MLHPALIAVIGFCFGAVFGSFTNVVAYRMHTGRSLNDRSHCLSCGRTLRWYELVPVFSYAALRGRCGTCGSWVPLRYLGVEVASGITYAFLALSIDDPALLVLSCALASVLIVTVLYDLAHFIIPDEMVLVASGIAFAWFAYGAYAGTGEGSLVSHCAGAAIAFLFYGGLWYVSGGRWLGFGDAKLAVPLGFLVGIGGVFSFIVLSFWVGALVSLALMAFGSIVRGGQSGLRFDSGPIKMKSEVPFAPFLIVAFALVFLFRIDVLALVTYAF